MGFRSSREKTPRAHRRRYPPAGQVGLAKARRAWLDALTDEEIAAAIGNDPDTFEPEPGRLDHAVVVRAGRPKQRLTLRLDADLVAWFKAQGPDYQARINAILCAYVERAQTDALSHPSAFAGLLWQDLPYAGYAEPPHRSRPRSRTREARPLRRSQMLERPRNRCTQESVPDSESRPQVAVEIHAEFQRVK
jgi:uncharacterized protein (DUF4415 family)